MLADNYNEDYGLARKTYYGAKDRIKRMELVTNFKDARIDAKCVLVREKLVAFETYYQEMSKAQLIKLCNEIIATMIDILELTEE